MSTAFSSKPRHCHTLIYFVTREREGRDVRLVWHTAPPTGLEESASPSPHATTFTPPASDEAKKKTEHT